MKRLNFPTEYGIRFDCLNAHELVSDRRFSVQEHCVIKRFFLNHQFCNAGITSNFDIAACRIHARGLLVVLETGVF